MLYKRSALLSSFFTIAAIGHTNGVAGEQEPVNTVTQNAKTKIDQQQTKTRPEMASRQAAQAHKKPSTDDNNGDHLAQRPKSQTQTQKQQEKKANEARERARKQQEQDRKYREASERIKKEEQQHANQKLKQEEQEQQEVKQRLIEQQEQEMLKQELEIQQARELAMRLEQERRDIEQRKLAQEQELKERERKLKQEEERQEAWRKHLEQQERELSARDLKEASFAEDEQQDFLEQEDEQPNLFEDQYVDDEENSLIVDPGVNSLYEALDRHINELSTATDGGATSPYNLSKTLQWLNSPIMPNESQSAKLFRNKLGIFLKTLLVYIAKHPSTALSDTGIDAPHFMGSIDNLPLDKLNMLRSTCLKSVAGILECACQMLRNIPE